MLDRSRRIVFDSPAAGGLNRFLTAVFGTDCVGQVGKAVPCQFLGDVLLDLLDEAGALVDEPGIKLDE